MLSKPTLLIMIIIIIIIIGILVFWLRLDKPDSKMANPFSGTPSPIPTLIPSPTPKTFNFDSSTDLRGELETVNPQVLDSDFE